MMAEYIPHPEKTVYFGSFFTWTNSGIKDLITRFQERYPDQGNIPSVGYDSAYHVFWMKSSEPLASRLFSALLNAAIDFNREFKDHTEEELIIPMDNTYVPDEYGAMNGFQGASTDHVLIDLDQHSDDSSDESSSAASGGVCCVYWIPNCGEISILTDDIACAIATLTESFLYREPVSRQVKIMNGDMQTALAKLQRMEGLMEQLSRHRTGQGSNVDKSLLMLSSLLPGNGVVHLPVSKTPHLERIMVHHALRDEFDHMLVGEERIYDRVTGKYTIPENLLSIQPKADSKTRPSQIWAGRRVRSIGSKQNSVPRTPSASNSTASGGPRRSTPMPVEEPSRFLPLQDQARMREWSKNIDVEADPATSAEQPVEEEQIEGMTAEIIRRIDDSDTDEEKTDVPKPGTARLIATDSDDELDMATPAQQVAAKERPIEQTQNLLAQYASAIRTSRATRRTQVPIATTLQHWQPKMSTLVSTDSFFAGIPRDEANGEAGQLQGSTHPEGAKRSQPKQVVTSRGSQSRHLHSFDGTFDMPPILDDDEIEEPRDTCSPGGHRPNDRNSASPHIAHEETIMHNYVLSDSFNPASYGSSRRRGQASNGRGTSKPQSKRSGEKQASWKTVTNKNLKPHSCSSQQDVDSQSVGQARPIPSMPGLCRTPWDNGSPQRKSARNRLVDTSTEITEQATIQPPAGFTVRSGAAERMEHVHILDGPLEEIERPSLKPVWDGPMYQSDDTSFSASSSSGGLRQSRFDFIPQTKINKPDLTHMRSSTLQLLKSARHQENKTKEKDNPVEKPPEQIAETDEVSSRRFYETMNLQAPNPGRGKTRRPQAVNQETSAQKQARIAAVKQGLQAEALAGAQQKQARHAENELSTQPSKPTEKAQQAADSNHVMVATHASSSKEVNREELSKNLVEAMSPILEAARTFTGKLELEAQLGRLLVVPTSRIKTDRVVESKKWRNIFEDSGTSTCVKFTNILTNDGADVDGILELKFKKDRMWNKDLPGRTSTTFEFHCTDSYAQAFILVFHEDGSHVTNRGQEVVGKIGVHCPGRVWDVCAVLTGTAPWTDMPVDLHKEIQTFASTVYIGGYDEAGSSVAVHFRPPTTNFFSIQDVVMRRMSLHNCQIPGEEKLQLKITEVKTLFIEMHKTDKRLHRASEFEQHDRMADQALVHYEVAILHTETNGAFTENESLEVGEETFAMALSIFTTKCASALLDAAFKVVDKIDWVGGTNYGTLVQKSDTLYEKEKQLAQTLPFSAYNPTLIRPVNHPSGYSVVAQRTNVGTPTDTRSTAATKQPVHGIRAGTQAQIYTDNQSNFFRLGMGGARIPISRDVVGSVGRSEVRPDDSASQAGRRPRVAPPTKVACSDKPDGFW